MKKNISLFMFSNLNNEEVRSMVIRGKPMQGTYRENIIINL